MKGTPSAIAIRAGLLAAFASAWFLPVWRAVRLLDSAAEVYLHDVSRDAWDDYVFGQQLLISYGFCLFVAVGLVWLFSRDWNRLLILPLAASLIIAFYVTWLRPESVIVLFPAMQPFRPAVFSAVVGLAALLMVRLYPQTGPEPDGVTS